MPSGVVMPPTRPVLEASEMIDDLAGRFLAAASDIPALGRFEAAAEAVNLFSLVVRHAEGVIALARTDLVLLPAALIVSRACLETAVKAAWLVDADDPYEREARWLAHLHGEERYLARVANRLGAGDVDAAAAMHRRAEQISDFRVAVTERLPAHISPLPGFPSFEQMLASIDGERIYSLYIHLSQIGHGEHAATWLYRGGGLGTEKTRGEFVTVNDWALPLRTCFRSLTRPGALVLARLNGDASRLASAGIEAMFEHRLASLGMDNRRVH